jgi:enoyl-CoA hydratase
VSEVEAASSLILDRDGPIVTLTMNRPERGNSLSLDMVGRLAAAWDLVDGDPDILCVVLTGAGPRYYCTGGDLATGWMAAGYVPSSDAERQVIEEPGRIGKALLLTYWLRTPLIAAVNGACLGGGCEMLQQTDIRVGEEHATFALPETGRGLIPAAGSTMRLKRQLPYAIAMEMLLTGRRLDAEEALRWGLINHVVPAGQGLAKARHLAEMICAKGPLAMAATKASAVETGWLAESVAQPIEAGYAQVVTRSADAKEGMAAFAEKRPPRFRRQ